MFTSILTLLPLALSVFATPLAVRQDDAPNCGVFGENGLASLTGRFHLAAVNTTLPNANSTGVPLTSVTNGATGGGSSAKLSTWASFPIPDGLISFTLNNGALLPENAVEGHTSNFRIEHGDRVSWISGSNVAAPTHAWCGVNNADDSGHAVLAAHGDINGFNLCVAGSFGGATNDIVWYPTTENNPPYLPETCYPVRLHIVQDE